MDWPLALLAETGLAASAYPDAAGVAAGAIAAGARVLVAVDEALVVADEVGELLVGAEGEGLVAVVVDDDGEVADIGAAADGGEGPVVDAQATEFVDFPDEEDFALAMQRTQLLLGSRALGLDRRLRSVSSKAWSVLS